MRLYALTCVISLPGRTFFVPDVPREEIIEGRCRSLSPSIPGNVLFDTGPHPGVFQDAFARWGGLAKAFEPLGNERSGILAQLEAIRLKAEDIRYVVNSHLHFDHAGGNQFFPQSIFLVSRKEMEWAKKPEMKEKDTSGPTGIILSPTGNRRPLRLIRGWQPGHHPPARPHSGTSGIAGPVEKRRSDDPERRQCSLRGKITSIPKSRAITSMEEQARKNNPEPEGPGPERKSPPHPRPRSGPVGEDQEGSGRV